MLLGLGGLATAAFPGLAGAATVDAVTAAFTGGATPRAGGVTLTAPEIADNGDTVPIEVSAPGAVAIMLVAPGNPEPTVATFTFGPAAGDQRVSTRIRLARTQEVTALARMADGSVVQAQAMVEVTIGGCGG
jgi:sulfur-oxidizing protein SoxY